MANGLSVLGEQRDVICRQQRQRPFAKLSTKQRSREGANSHPHRQMGARPISGLAGGEELAGILVIQAALDLGPGGSLGAALWGGGGNLQTWSKGWEMLLFPHSKCCGSCEVPDSRDRLLLPQGVKEH